MRQRVVLDVEYDPRIDDAPEHWSWHFGVEIPPGAVELISAEPPEER